MPMIFIFSETAIQGHWRSSVIVPLLPICHDVRPTVCLGRGWIVIVGCTSNVLGTLTPKHVHLLSAVFFPVPPAREVGYWCANYTWYLSDILRTVEDRGYITIDRKSYVPHRLAPQRMTLSDLEWPFHASRAISAVAELLVVLCKIHRNMLVCVLGPQCSYSYQKTLKICAILWLTHSRWRLGVVVSVVGRINEVNQHRPRLVDDGWPGYG